MKKVLTALLVYLLAIGGIAFAFFIPYFVFKYEDRRTNNYDIHYAAEKLELENFEINFYDKLDDFPFYLSELSYMYIYNEESASSKNIASNLSRKEVIDKSINDLCDVFLGDRLTGKMGSYSDRIMRAGGFKKFLKSSPNLSVLPAYVIRTDKNDMFLVWSVDYYDDDLGSLSVIIDDDTGKILMIQCYMNGELSDQFSYYFSEDSYKKRLESYYNLTLDSENHSERANCTICDYSFYNSAASEPGDEITLQSIFEGTEYYTNSILFNYIDASEYIYDSPETPEYNQDDLQIEQN